MDEFDDLQYKWEEGGREELCAPLPGLLDHNHHHGDGEDGGHQHDHVGDDHVH